MSMQRVMLRSKLHRVTVTQADLNYGLRGSGEISLNGAAARRAHPGHLPIIRTYAPISEDQAKGFIPRIVFVDDKNAITAIKP